MKPSIVVYAAVPPPEHGQSRMVAAMLAALCDDRAFEILHVNARFSMSLDEIGEGSWKKFLLSLQYILQAIRLALKHRGAALYYIPGPVKISAVVRDWLTLAILRLFYRNIIFHWHAIGHGEWAHGSDRVSLKVPSYLDRLARRISALVLDKPRLSIAVSAHSNRDAVSVGSLTTVVVSNGIDDPCPDYPNRVSPLRLDRQRHLRTNPNEPIRLLFLSHGTEAKGLFDVIESMRLCAQSPAWKARPVLLTLAGGVSREAKQRFLEDTTVLETEWKGRLTIHTTGFLEGSEKSRCYEDHDLFLAPSRWESFGLTVVEAMAHGLPVVAAASDGVAGILGDEYPYLAPTADPAALSRRIDEAVLHLCSGDSAEMSKQLRRSFEDQYTSQAFRASICSALALPPTKTEQPDASRLNIMVYLADQHVKLGRSLGIQRMTQVVLEALTARGDIRIGAVVSKSSVQAPTGATPVVTVPWSTRPNVLRALTDNLHPLFTITKRRPDLWYFPKGFMPRFHGGVYPSVATIHDTIIQYYQDHYPHWRLDLEYNYWASMLRNTLLQATVIMTVSQHSKRQIEDFIRRHKLPERKIHVMYESCLYENIPQPVNPPKADHVVHLGSCEPHKRTAWLIRLWSEWSALDDALPYLHVIGTIPEEVANLAKDNPKIVHLTFLEDKALVSQFTSAKALILPSEIEGFGLPAIEAYYLGTPVCFVKDTSVEEVLSATTHQGSFDLNHPESLRSALADVLAMSAEQIRNHGLHLREQYHSTIIVDRMVHIFQTVGPEAPRPPAPLHCREEG